MNKKLYLVISALFIIIPLSFLSVEGDLLTGMIGCYDFENANLGYNQKQPLVNGTISGTITQVSGKVGNAADFEVTGGADYIDITNLLSNGLNPTNEHSVCAWHNMESLTSDQWIIGISKSGATGDYSGTFHTAASTIYRTAFYVTDGNQRDTLDNPTASNWRFLCHNINSAGQILYPYVSGTFYNNLTTYTLNPSGWNKAIIGGLWYNAAIASTIDGQIDEVMIWNRSLLMSEITTLYNSDSGKSCDDILIAADTTPPTITNIKQNPTNLTIFNGISNHVHINASITDGTGVNTTSVKLNYNTTFVNVYINGTKKTTNLLSYSYNHTGSNIYHWFLDENDFLSSTNNLAEEWFENTTHSVYNLTSQNAWLKIKFFNVSATADLSFTEYYDQAMSSTTTTKSFYYCNSSYVNGNPTNSPYCTLFFQGTNQDAYDHSHGTKSKHKIYPMGINTTSKTLNGIGVTNTSYILKRGTSVGESIYYIPKVTRTNQVQVSTNLGNTWSNFAGTPDSHIHQIKRNSAIYYNICAQDTLGNKACSSTATDIIDFENVPPSNVVFLAPINGTYNGTFNIEYTRSFPVTPCTITTYRIEYKKTTSSAWSDIIANNYPALTYEWDTSLIVNGDYNLRVNVTDSCNEHAVTISDTFTIYNIGEDVALLQDILEELQGVSTIQEENEGDIMLFGIIVFIGIFFTLGLLTRYYLLISLSGLGFVFIFFKEIERATIGNFSIVLSISSLLLGIALILGGGILYLMNMQKPNRSTLKRIYN